jgi:CxxC-x17-CxxC domain-containing protein
MGNFDRPRRGGFGGGSRSGGSRGGFGGDRGGFGGRGGGFGERRPLEMHDATCSKCNKQCQVPFKPSGDKPVFCSDCFRNEGGSSSSFSPRRPSFDRPSSSSSGMSQEQFKQVNAKLDKILEALNNLEVVDEEGDEEAILDDEDEAEELVEEGEKDNKDSKEDLDEDSDEDLDEESPNEPKIA